MHRSAWAFAAESHDLDTYAQGKRVAKSLPLVVGNLVSDGLGGEDNQVVLYDDEGRHPLERAPKAGGTRHPRSHFTAAEGLKNQCPRLTTRFSTHV
jgi:phosphopantothenoylcysteine decarboxylase/phosphopantothenate--cysteine ligase